ncbi:MAG: hypothetical protein RMH77_02145 [Sulfolobales archaeon]|nr:hypothetical protein [Sulfolobales archaeon]MCX8185932.1 hypothetical protein [Sulfolobales archaeon]MDW7969189.1 hypothetical protein [Sulfolobales archaeon]
MSKPKIKVIDLRYREPGCTSHPAVLLNNFLKNLTESEALIRVSTEDIPIKVLEVFVDRYGFRISAKKEELGYVEVLISKA